MNHSPNTTDRNRGGFAERLATGLLVAFFTGLGWVTLVDGGISLHGKTGAVSHLTGAGARWFALSAFAVAAIASLLLSKSLWLSSRGAATFAAAVLLHPALYLLCPA